MENGNLNIARCKKYMSEYSVFESAEGLPKEAFITPNKPSLTFDDAWLVARYSTIKSRDDVDISTNIFNDIKLKIPIISSPMDAVCEDEMLTTLAKIGSCGILHRACSIEEQRNMFTKGIKKWLKISQKDEVGVFGISFGMEWSERMKMLEEVIEELKDAGVYPNRVRILVCLDVANAFNKYYIEALKSFYEYVMTYQTSIRIIAGSVYTPQSIEKIHEEVNCKNIAIRLNIGIGSACITKVICGVGVGGLTSLIECCGVAKDLEFYSIVDGGVSNSGQILKGIAAGADCVMTGKLLSPTNSSPAQRITKKEFLFDPWYEKSSGYYPRNLKELDDDAIIGVLYRGMASKAVQDKYNEKNRKSLYIEGEHDIFLPYKGNTESVVEELCAGIRSGCSYVNAHSLKDLKDVKWRMTHFSGYLESLPHAKFR